MAAAKLKFPGISDELSEILDANMDEAPNRRRAREAFKDIQLNIDHILLKATCDGLKTEEVRSQNLSFYYFLFTFRTKGSLSTQKSGIGPKL